MESYFTKDCYKLSEDHRHTSICPNKRGTRDRKRRFLQCTTICSRQNTKTEHPYHHGWSKCQSRIKENRKGEIGLHGIVNINVIGELFADFCAVNRQVIGGTLFPHKNCHKITWVSPAGNAENQIDHIAIFQRWRSSLQDVRNKRGADAASDHHLLTATIKLKLLSNKKAEQKRRKFHVAKLKE